MPSLFHKRNKKRTSLAKNLEGRFPPVTSPPDKQRQQTLEAIMAWLLEEAERQPVLQIWEDVQWADPTTLELAIGICHNKRQSLHDEPKKNSRKAVNPTSR